MPTEGREWCNDPALYFRKEDASRVFTLHKEIADDVYNAGAKKILDYGSGDGKILDSFPSISGPEITLHDPEEVALSEAREKFGGHSNVNFEADCDKLPSAYYDAVILCNVIMVIRTEEELKTVFCSLRRVLRTGGTLYAGLTHPCFLDREFATYANDFTRRTKEFNYFDDGAAYKVYMEQGGLPIVITDFFWSLSLLVTLFLKSGFTLLGVKELRDVEENRYPPFMVLRLGPSAVTVASGINPIC